MLRLRSAALVVLALVVSSFALIGPSAPASADPVPLGLEAGDLVISDSGPSRVIVHPADGFQITARYVGTPDFAGSQAQVAWVDPAIT